MHPVIVWLFVAFSLSIYWYMSRSAFPFLRFLLHFLLVLDCASNPTATGDITLQPGESINVASPNFPSLYSSYLNMIWKITVLSFITVFNVYSHEMVCEFILSEIDFPPDFFLFAWNDLFVPLFREHSQSWTSHAFLNHRLLMLHLWTSSATSKESRGNGGAGKETSSFSKTVVREQG